MLLWVPLCLQMGLGLGLEVASGQAVGSKTDSQKQDQPFPRRKP